MAEQEQTTTPETQQPEQKPVAPSAATQNTDTPPQEQTVPYARFKEVNDRLKALEDEQAKRQREQQEADEKRLAEQQQWQKLYESRKADVEKLTPKAELADKLSALVLEQYAAEIKEWPEQVRAMAPAEDADVLVKLDWLKRAKPLAQELMGDKTPPPGNGRRPTPVGPSGVAKTADAQRDTWSKRAAARYR